MLHEGDGIKEATCSPLLSTRPYYASLTKWELTSLSRRITTNTKYTNTLERRDSSGVQSPQSVTKGNVERWQPPLDQEDN